MLKIAEKRKERGMTRQLLADKVGLTYETIRNYEKGQREPSVGVLVRISDVLECTMEDLVVRKCALDARRARFPERWYESQRKAHEERGRSVVGIHMKTGELVRFVCLIDCRKKGFHPSAVCKCCKGERQSHKGYTWRYENG